MKKITGKSDIKKGGGNNGNNIKKPSGATQDK
jgi:hypothetical protein